MRLEGGNFEGSKYGFGFLRALTDPAACLGTSLTGGANTDFSLFVFRQKHKSSAACWLERRGWVRSKLAASPPMERRACGGHQQISNMRSILDFSCFVGIYFFSTATLDFCELCVMPLVRVVEQICDWK